MVCYSIGRYSSLSRKERNKTISPKTTDLFKFEGWHKHGCGGKIRETKIWMVSSVVYPGYFDSSKVAQKDEY